jgi:hypothetical protein
VTARLFTNQGTGLRPLSPVQLGGGRDASNNAQLIAVRRTRVGGEWRDYVDVPLAETTEAYEVDICDDDTYTTVVRTISGLTTPLATYSAANQTSDGLTPGNPIYFVFYQLSELVGRGFPGYGVI